MARNSERAMLLLNRWQEMKSVITRTSGTAPRRRPRNSAQCDNLKDAEYWRNGVVKEISLKIAEIQNAALGELRLTELNDEINRLLRDKSRWEDRIAQLGGPDYQVSAASMFDSAAITTRDGYKYFGAAKELPSVQALLEQQKIGKRPHRMTRGELAAKVSATYYGYRDEQLYPDMLVEEKEQEELLLARWPESAYTLENMESQAA